MVRTLAQAGVEVATNNIPNIDLANHLAAELRGRNRRAVAAQADVTDPAAIKAMRDAIVKATRPTWHYGHQRGDPVSLETRAGTAQRGL